MIPVQELSFHLNSNEVIFAHLFSLGDGNFTAQVSGPYDLNSIPQIKFYQWLACPSDSDASAAFFEIVDAISRKCSRDSSKLIKVNNPCNCEFLPQSKQQLILGEQISVVVNETI